MRYNLPLSFPRPPLTQNRMPKNPRAYNRIKGEIHNEVLLRARAARLPRGVDRVHVDLHWLPATIRARDTDNLAPTLKACIDALSSGTRNRAGYGVVIDDNHQHVTSNSVIHYADPHFPGPRMWIVLHVLDDEEVDAA